MPSINPLSSLTIELSIKSSQRQKFLQTQDILGFSSRKRTKKSFDEFEKQSNGVYNMLDP
jgi:hypothetical protein